MFALVLLNIIKDTTNPLQQFIFTNIDISRLPLWVGYFIYLKFICIVLIVCQLLHPVQLKKQIG